jgi:hypothetical protein
MAEEGDKEVLLNIRLDGQGIHDLKSIAVGRESGNVRKDVINILDLNVLYL